MFHFPCTDSKRLRFYVGTQTNDRFRCIYDNACFLRLKQSEKDLFSSPVCRGLLPGRKAKLKALPLSWGFVRWLVVVGWFLSPEFAPSEKGARFKGASPPGLARSLPGISPWRSGCIRFGGPLHLAPSMLSPLPQAARAMLLSGRRWPFHPEYRARLWRLKVGHLLCKSTPQTGQRFGFEPISRACVSFSWVGIRS